MHRVLWVLLELHARSGGSAVLMSATSPRSQRDELLAAWFRGRGSEPVPSRCDGYPLVTHLCDKGLEEYAIATRAAMRRSVRVRHESNEHAVVQALIVAANEGRCACWIRNTVRDAITSYETLAATLGDRVELFHARFALGDRLEIEQRVLRRFGKDSNSSDRAGRVLVATQVVEQALDLDFDLLVTDLAPIDLILQRAGRLHRHDRGDRGTPTLWIHGPLPEPDAGPEWLVNALVGTAHVYPDHGQLWLSSRLLAEHGEFAMSEDARHLIEAVYGAAEVDLPQGLRAVNQRAVGRAAVNQAIARANAISPAGGYEADGTDYWRDQHAPTRLGEPTLTLVLADWNGERLKPLVTGSDAVRAQRFP